MKQTKLPEFGITSFKRTKILATLGPATNSYESIVKMIEAGANGFRLNFSHGEASEKKQQVEWIRKASRTLGKPVAVVQDLQGPKIRLGILPQPLEVKGRQKLTLCYEKDMIDGAIPTQYNLAQIVKPGEKVLFYDGRIKSKVVEVSKKTVTVEIINSGTLASNKGINIPDTDLGGAILTQKDLADIDVGVEIDVDFVALSFLQSANDVENLRKILAHKKSNAKIISKIETMAAVENLVSIVKASDAVMVARGDLAVEVSLEAVPILQRQIIGLCREHAKMCIVATQMLASMTTSIEPTRAEVSDVATAVIVGADCVMLSEETAVGDFAVETVATMKRIIKYAEANSPLKPVFYSETNHTIKDAIASATLALASQVRAKAIVAETKSGQTAISIASHRPNMPIIMVTSQAKVAQQLTLVYGGKVFIYPDEENAGAKVADWLRDNGVFKKGDVVVRISGEQPGLIGGTDTIKVRVLE